MELLYADKRIAVAVKPPGVLSTDEPGGMPELLRAQLGTPCIRTVHRLDAATGGVMVFARSAAAASILSGQVREHRFRKIYLAVVRGDPGQGGIWRDMLGRDPVRRVTYIAREPGKDVRPAELSYETLAVREGLSLVRVTLHTGRTHQIRVQFAGRGFPLVGDRKYGGAGDGPGYGVHPPAPGGLALDPVSPAGNGKIRQKSARSTWLRALETVQKGLRLF